jgi:hypothetical protein
MKNHRIAPRIAATIALAALGFGLAAAPAEAGLFHRRTVVVESPTVYVAPVETVYAVPVSTVVAAPAPVAVPAPVVVDSAVTATTYVPTVSTGVVAAPVVSTYVPTVTTVPAVVVPARRMRVVFPRRVYYYGY